MTNFQTAVVLIGVWLVCRAVVRCFKLWYSARIHHENTVRMANGVVPADHSYLASDQSFSVGARDARG